MGAETGGVCCAWAEPRSRALIGIVLNSIIIHRLLFADGSAEWRTLDDGQGEDGEKRQGTVSGLQ
jgi:hypothetical protein